MVERAGCAVTAPCRADRATVRHVRPTNRPAEVITSVHQTLELLTAQR